MLFLVVEHFLMFSKSLGITECRRLCCVSISFFDVWLKWMSAGNVNRGDYLGLSILLKARFEISKQAVSLKGIFSNPTPISNFIRHLQSSIIYLHRNNSDKNFIKLLFPEKQQNKLHFIVTQKFMRTRWKFNWKFRFERRN